MNLVSPPQAEVPAVYRAHDLLLFTSWYEAFALPPLEAMASGVPVVATQCGGITTFATAGQDAVLCPVGDAAALARAVAGGAGRSRGRRGSSRARGRAAAERFGWERTIDAVEDGLRQVAAQAARRVAPVTGRTPEIAVVVVADGPWEATLRTLAALARAAAGVPHVLVGVDDGTRDETAGALPRLPGMLTLRSDLPRGFAAAAVAGAAAARTPWLAFLRSGAEPRRGWLAGLLEAARAHPGAAALAGLLVRPDRPPGLERRAGRPLDPRRAGHGACRPSAWPSGPRPSPPPRASAPQRPTARGPTSAAGSASARRDAAGPPGQRALARAGGPGRGHCRDPCRALTSDRPAAIGARRSARRAPTGQEAREDRHAEPGPVGGVLVAADDRPGREEPRVERQRRPRRAAAPRRPPARRPPGAAVARRGPGR